MGRASLLFLLTILVLSSTAQAQMQTGVCDRTPQVRDALVAIVGGEAGCAEVTADQLGRISVLSLGSERIETLQSGDFAGLSSLEQLDLYDNELTALPPNVFAGLTKLRQLNLWHNDLASLSPNVFADLTNLRILDLDDNDFADIPRDVFAGLTNLEYLWLNDTRLTTLPSGIFAGPTNLETLVVSGNEFTTLPPDVFAGLTNLQTLRLNNNSLTALPSDIFTGLTNLQSLWLHDNHLTALSPNIFTGLTNLAYLYLHENDLTALPPGVFSGLTSLRTLFLARNRLTALPPDIFTGLTNLATLEIDTNQLTGLPPTLFAGLSSLRVLDLGGNHLTALPPKVFAGLSSLRQVWLNANPGAPFPVAIALENTTPAGGVVVTVASGAPFAMTVDLSATGATLSTPSVTVATGSVTSDPLTVIPTGGPVRITLGAAPALPSDSCSWIDLPCYRGLMPTVSSEPFEPDVVPLTPPVDTHADTPRAATRVRSTSTTPGQIGPASDVDYFQVRVPQAGTLTVETTGAMDTVGTLWRGSEEITTDDDGGAGYNFRLVAPVAAGTYVVAVRGYGAATGQYTLAVNFVVGALDRLGTEAFQSGLGFISGWVCEAELIELEIDGEAVLTVPYGTDREDSLEPCGDRNNGFVLGMNWNLLGDGKHTVRVLADGLEFGTATLSVTTLGVEFLTGGQGDYLLSDFPQTGQQIRLVWQEALQNFAITPVSPPVESESEAESEPTQSDPPVKSELPSALENPLAGSFQSGIGLVSGWVCGAEQVEIEIDGTATFEAAYGASREDTAERCDDSNTGFGLRLNWNEFGDGEHTVRALADGKELGRATFTVTTLGETFLTGVSGVYDLPDFPDPDTTVTVEWQEASQNFVIIEADGVEGQSPDSVQ
jgi:Leucine-rich repeat (LRR) protein